MRARSLLLVCLAVAWPDAAQAKTWWDYLEALSGPGPFKGKVNLTANVYCAGQISNVGGKRERSDTFKPPLFDDHPNWLGRSTLPATLAEVSATPCVYFDYAKLEAEGAAARFTFPVQATFLETGLNYRLLHSLEVGAGLGLLTFRTQTTATDIVVHRAALTPVRLTLMPLHALPALRKRSWPGAFQVYFRQSFIVGALDGEDFGIAADQFREESEFVRSFGFRVDVTKLLRF